MAEKSTELSRFDPVTGVERNASTERADFSPADAPEETEMIKARIEETRKEMGETIDAIQERLSFSNISEQVTETVSSAIETAKDTAYDATIGKAVSFMKNVGDGVTNSNAFRTVRSNPFPLALIGIGAGLLAYQAFGPGRSKSKYGNGPRRRYDESPRLLSEGHSSVGSKPGAYKRISDSAGSAVDTLKEKTSAAYGSASDALSRAYDGAGDAAHRAYDRANDVAHRTYDRANDVAHRAYDRVGEYGTIAHDKYDEYMDENPLAVGAVALAVGAAVGLAIPSTRYEGRMMGEARDKLLQQTHDAVDSIVDSAKRAANEAGNSFANEIR